ncbi:MAG: hypothetical protein HS116_23015 [Planctomycetes bacterium]|nr:hypothetical protein [Planctomycetota bacterium]
MRTASPLRIVSLWPVWALLGAFEVCAGEPARPPIETLLPPHFGFGISCYGSNGQWPERSKSELGVPWDFGYVYAFANSEESYLTWFFERSERMRVRPVLSFYGLLKLGQEQGIAGTEIEIVLRVLKDPALMRRYLEAVKRLLQICAKQKQPVIFHVEPDSWAFMEWHGTEETHDATKCPAMVKSSGLPEAANFPDHAGGLGQALLHLRDLYAPRVYMGFHCKDCRAGTNPELTVKFVRGCGAWDILIGDGIGHVYGSRGTGWWDTFEEARFQRYMTWFGTVTRELGLKYIHWQSVIGKADYTLLPDYPARERVRAYMNAGGVAVLFDLQGDPDKGGGRSTPHHGYSDAPPPGHPAENTVQALCARLRKYYAQPIPFPGRAAPTAKAPEESVRVPAAQPAPVAAKPLIDAAALAAWDGKLQARAQQALKDGASVHTYLRLFGEKDTPKRYKLAAVSAAEVQVLVQGNKMPVAWKNLSVTERAQLARGVVEAVGDEPSALVLAGVYLAGDGKLDQAEECLAKAALKDAALVVEARKVLRGAVP